MDLSCCSSAFPPIVNDPDPRRETNSEVVQQQHAKIRACARHGELCTRPRGVVKEAGAGTEIGRYAGSNPPCAARLYQQAVLPHRGGSE